LFSKIEFHGRCDGNPEVLNKIRENFANGSVKGYVEAKQLREEFLEILDAVKHGIDF
jgi:hypothetical protein